MSALPAIIIAQLLTIILIVNSSSALPKLNQAKHSLSKVLGVQIAQTETSPDQPPPSDNSPNLPPEQPTQPSSEPQNTTPAPENNPSPPPPTDQSTQPVIQETTPSTPTTEPPSPYSSPTPDNPSYFNDVIAPTAQTGPPSPSTAPTLEQPTPSAQLVTNPQESTPMQTAAVLNPQEVINSPEAISQQAVEEVKKEADQLNKTADPIDQTKLLINFTADKVKDINEGVKNDNFSTTNFASQRFNDYLDQTVNHLQNLSPSQSGALKRQLTNFCQQADFILKSAQLQVPEEAEQDLEINRAKCLNLQP